MSMYLRSGTHQLILLTLKELVVDPKPTSIGIRQFLQATYPYSVKIAAHLWRLLQVSYPERFEEVFTRRRIGGSRRSRCTCTPTHLAIAAAATIVFTTTIWTRAGVAQCELGLGAVLLTATTAGTAYTTRTAILT